MVSTQSGHYGRGPVGIYHRAKMSPDWLLLTVLLLMSTSPIYAGREGCNATADVMLVLDSSSSIGIANWNILTKSLKDMVLQLDVGYHKTRVGLVTFSKMAHFNWNLLEYTDKNSLGDALFNLEHIRGGTNSSGALWILHSLAYRPEQGDRPEVPNICLFFTDGMSNRDAARTVPEADMVHDQDIEVYTIAIGEPKNFRHGEMSAIASEPANTHILSVSDFSNLDDIIEDLSNAMCPEEDKCKSSPCKNYGACRRSFDGYKCKCTEQYEGKRCETLKTPTVAPTTTPTLRRQDVIIMLDVTGSMMPTSDKRYLSNIVEFLDAFLRITSKDDFWAQYRTNLRVLQFTTDLKEEIWQLDYDVFSSAYELRVSGRNGIDDFRNKILAKEPVSRTNIGQSVKTMRDKFKPNEDGMVILVSDFMNMIHVPTLTGQVRALRDAKVHLYPVLLDKTERDEATYELVKAETVDQIGIDVRAAGIPAAVIKSFYEKVENPAPTHGDFRLLI